MNNESGGKNGSLIFSNPLAIAGEIALILLLPLAARSGGVVTTCSEANLRAAMAGGGLVTFACDGLITLAGTITNESDTALDASGHQVTISGNDIVRVFYVKTNVMFSMLNLTIAGGAAPNGAGIFNAGGALRLVNSTFLTNVASTLAISDSSAIRGEGGAIFNQGGAVNGINCLFVGNRAQQITNSPDWYGAPAGGAIANDRGQVSLWNCGFQANRVWGAAGAYVRPVGVGPPAQSTPGSGGAILNGGTLTANFCTFLDNSAKGGDGGTTPGPCGYNSCSFPALNGFRGSDASGGAIFNSGTMEISASTFAGNTAVGGAGGPGGWGPAWSYGIQGGIGGSGGNSSGGDIYNNGTAGLINCTIATNVCLGGNGGTGGTGGMALSSGLPGGKGGNGGGGGTANGNCFGPVGKLTLINCTFVLNQGIAGSGGAGGAGGLGAHPGDPQGVSGNPGSPGSAFWGIKTLTCNLLNTLLASNAPGGNFSGTALDAGHNLSSDATPVFTNAGSLNHTAPLLGSLANNGGPTLTLSLLAGNPAIDAGDSANAPATDQRGFVRPAGVNADIGACEGNSSPRPRMWISLAPRHGLDIFVCGLTGLTSRLLTSTDLTSWSALMTNVVGQDGLTFFPIAASPNEPARFHRIALPKEPV